MCQRPSTEKGSGYPAGKCSRFDTKGSQISDPPQDCKPLGSYLRSSESHLSYSHHPASEKFSPRNFACRFLLGLREPRLGLGNAAVGRAYIAWQVKPAAFKYMKQCGWEIGSVCGTERRWWNTWRPMLTELMAMLIFALSLFTVHIGTVICMISCLSDLPIETKGKKAMGSKLKFSILLNWDLPNLSLSREKV